MATLHERLTGEGLTDNEPPENARIAVSAFMGAINEVRKGYFTKAQMKSIYNMTASQQSDLDTMAALVAAAPDTERFLRVFEDWLAMGSVNLAPAFRNTAEFVTRLENEITDQGGTPP
jgi:hypothetical protein